MTLFLAYHFVKMSKQALFSGASNLHLGTFLLTIIVPKPYNNAYSPNLNLLLVIRFGLVSFVGVLRLNF